MKYIILLTLVCLCCTACARLDSFERTAVIPDQEWYYNNTPGFTFNITDTAARYTVFIVLRHTDAYKYNNIWLGFASKGPGESAQIKKIEISLGNDATGWEGNGMDDIFELRKIISPGPIPFKAGRYTFTISQIMRENPLKHILNVGVRIEKINL